MCRDFTCYIENMTDQSHVSWAHHGAAGNRCAKVNAFIAIALLGNKKHVRGRVQVCNSGYHGVTDSP